MTPEEERVLELLGLAHNAFQELPVAHGHDMPEFVAAIHACQNIVLARAGLRETGLFGVRLDPPARTMSDGT